MIWIPAVKCPVGALRESQGTQNIFRRSGSFLHPSEKKRLSSSNTNFRSR
jgi:hypothetical protein